MNQRGRDPQLKDTHDSFSRRHSSALVGCSDKASEFTIPIVV